MTIIQPSITTQSENLFVYVLKLMRLRWVIFTSGFQRAKPLQKALTIGIWLLVLAVFVGSYLLSNYILEQLNSPLIIESGINTHSQAPGLLVQGYSYS
jgi:hypothetical protein